MVRIMARKRYKRFSDVPRRPLVRPTPMSVEGCSFAREVANSLSPVCRPAADVHVTSANDPVGWEEIYGQQ
jgi:hypothetical protein